MIYDNNKKRSDKEDERMTERDIIKYIYQHEDPEQHRSKVKKRVK